jgi:DNA-binding MarR family transcriptional regulator
MARRGRTVKTLGRDARAAATACAGWNSRLAARRIQAFLDRHLAPAGLASVQFGLLAQIAAASDDTLAGLARRLALDPSTLSRTLRTLERAGWVEVAMPGADRRRRAAWLTEAGARRLEAALPHWRRGHAALSRAFDPRAAARLAAAAAALEPGASRR